MRSCRIPSEEYGLCVKAVFLFIFIHPSDHQAGVFQGCGELMLWCKPVSIVDHSEAALCHGQAIILVAFLVSVDPSAAVNQDKYGQVALSVLRPVYIQDMHRIRTVGNIVETDDSFRRGEPGIPDII